MKKKVIGQKLAINKTTISNLTPADLGSVKGGAAPTDYPCTTSCPVTFDMVCLSIVRCSD